MEAWLQNFYHWVQVGWLYYTLLGLLAFLESLAFVGLLFPGSVLIVFTGFLAANGKGDFLVLAAVYALGAFLGDLVSYILGARYSDSILSRPWFKKREGLLRKAEAYFVAHGGKSVFLGRFIGFLRPFIPFIAGSARMKPIPFILYALVSGILWGISYPGIGFVCGASWQMVQVWSGRFSLLFLILALLFLLNALFWRYLVPAIGRLVRFCWQRGIALRERLLASTGFQSFAGRHPRLWDFCRQRFSLEHGGGVSLTIGFVVSLFFAVLFSWFGRGAHPGSPFIQLDQRAYDLLAVVHHPWSDIFFTAVTYLGSGQVIVIIGSFVVLVLLLSNRDFSALVFVIGMAGGELFTAVVKALYDRPRPTPHFPQLEVLGASFPSGHAFSALLFYGLIIYFLLGTIRNWHTRVVMVFAGSFLILLIGLSRVLLGVHWISDVLGGFALASLWLTFLITACEIRFRYGGFPVRRGWRPFALSVRARLMILLPVAVGAAMVLYWAFVPDLRLMYLERSPRTLTVLAGEVAIEQLPHDLPLETENLFGQPQRPLSMVVIGEEELLFRRLAATGWRPAETPGVSGFFRLLWDLLRGVPSGEGAILPQLVEGRIQDAALVRADADHPQQASRTLLLWHLGRIYPDGRAVWGLLVSRQIDVQHILGLPLPLPLLDIAVDREREQLAAEIGESQVIDQQYRPSHIAPAADTPISSRAASPFVSDGQVQITILPLDKSPDKP